MTAKNTTNKFFEGYEELIARIDDLLKNGNREVIYTPFLEVNEQNKVSSFVGKQYPLTFYGGYEEAQRKRAVLSDCFDFDKVICLKSTYLTKYNKITHRDALGALMNLGIKRNTIGDIIVTENEIYLMVTDEIAPYIIANLQMIKRASVQFKRTYDEIDYHAQIDYHDAIVSSMRLDTLVGAIAKLSRDKSQKLINSGAVKVDHEMLEDTSFVCNNDCVISLHKYGRFHILNTGRITKNKNIVVRIGVYR